jgi:hypothetical protein
LEISAVRKVKYLKKTRHNMFMPIPAIYGALRKPPEDEWMTNPSR